MNSSFAVFLPSIRLACVCLCWWATQVSAADADPGKPANIDLRNLGFEGASSIQDNLWDGVASDGTLAGFNYSAEVVLESGRFGRLAMPPSIAYVDLNGDGVPDLFTADPTGYFRFYPNLGTAAAPSFTQAEILPIYLSMVSSVRANTVTREIGENSRNCPRFSLADWRHGGLLDLLIGNYLGEILFVPNMGTTRQPVFRQPSMPGGIAGARLMTSDKARLWGNLLSPAAIDFKNNGQPDLLLGEGTYSANSIHRLRNLSGGGMPKFNDAERSYIAYGDGREQLIPTVVDYDGDGNAGLLVADRTGEVGVYLNPGDAKTPGEAFKRVSTLTFGSTSKLPGLCSLYAADFNGDGLFDLLVGNAKWPDCCGAEYGQQGQSEIRAAPKSQRGRTIGTKRHSTRGLANELLPGAW